MQIEHDRIRDCGLKFCPEGRRGGRGLDRDPDSGRDPTEKLPDSGFIVEG
jgi:hypothetical protein